MYPNMVMLHRDIASGLVDYRYARIPGAEFKAKTYTPPYNGTMFPWESAFTGREVCPHGYGTCLREIHISGDIVCVGAPVMVSHGAHAFVVVTPPSVPAVQLRTASVLAHDEEQDVVAARSTANCDWVRGISSPLVALPPPLADVESCNHHDLRLCSVADFWISRATINSTGQGNIDNVIGPDEYHDHVNNRWARRRVACRCAALRRI